MWCSRTTRVWRYIFANEGLDGGKKEDSGEGVDGIRKEDRGNIWC